MNLNIFFIILKWTFKSLYRNFWRNFLTASVIGIGIISILFFLAFKKGVHKKMISNTTSFYISDFQINSSLKFNNSEKIKDYKKIYRKIKNNFPETQTVYRKIVYGIIENNRKNYPIHLIGTDYKKEKRVTLLTSTIIEGSIEQNSKIPAILIGASLQKKLNLKLNDKVKIILNIGNNYIPVNCKITGIYKASMNNFDLNNILIDFKKLKKIIKDDSVTEFSIKSKKNIKPKLKKLFPELNVSSWQDILPDIVKLIQLENAAMIVVSIIIYIIVFFSLVNALLISFYEKLKITGLMLNIGITPLKLSILILTESLVLGIISLLFGSIIAYGSVLYFQNYGMDLSYFLSDNPYFVLDMVIYPEFPINELINNIIIFICVLIISSFIPIFKLFKTKPIEIVREYL